MYILGLIDKQSSGTYKLQKAITDNLTDPQRSELRNRFFGFIFQGFHLLPRANAIRNVAMPLEYGASYGFQLTSKEIRDRAKIALERVGLESRMEHLPSELSGGQRQRVAIARALINNPSVIFADEPTGNLDSTTAQEIMDLFHRLNSEGTTIVLVTHDPHLAKQAKKQIVMSDGRIVGQ